MKYSLFLLVTNIIISLDLVELIYKEVKLRFRLPIGIIIDRGLVFIS
jgi:hypothetical protein